MRCLGSWPNDSPGRRFVLPGVDGDDLTSIAPNFPSMEEVQRQYQLADRRRIAETQELNHTASTRETHYPYAEMTRHRLPEYKGR